MSDAVKLVKHFVELFFALLTGRPKHSFDGVPFLGDSGVRVGLGCEVPRHPGVTLSDRDANQRLSRANSQVPRTVVSLVSPVRSFQSPRRPPKQVWLRRMPL
jgi:hypothetical protein